MNIVLQRQIVPNCYRNHHAKFEKR